MEVRTFWRLEGPDGSGPYRSSSVNPEITAMRAYHNRLAKEEQTRCPGMSRELYLWWSNPSGILFKRGKAGLLFGFTSKEQMQHWFTAEELVMLCSNGYTIKQYQSTEYCLDPCQAVFKKE